MNRLESIRQSANRPIVRYILVGGTSYVLELLVLYICKGVLHTSPVIAVSISFWAGFILSFGLQKVITFNNTSKKVKQLLWQSISYGILVIVNYLFTIGFVAFLNSITDVYIARTIALVITTGWNYVIYSNIIFKEKE